MFDYSGDFVGSPLKTPVTNKLIPSESVRTCAEDAGDFQIKGLCKTTCDKCVAELKEMFQSVQEAAKT